MFVRIAVALVALGPTTLEHSCLDPDPGEAPRDPRTQPLTLADALFSIRDVAGPLRLVDDLDGDGRQDMVAERGSEGIGEWKRELRIDAVSARDGHTIRTLWSGTVRTSVWYPAPAWDTGADCNGDRVPDLVVGLPAATVDGRRAGKVLVVSGDDGSVLHESSGGPTDDREGASVAMLDDVDGDGYCDYAVGAPQCDPELLGPPGSWPLLRGGTTGSEGRETAYVVLESGEEVPVEQAWEERLALRSDLPGRVSVRSGRDGGELWQRDGTRPGHAFGARMRAVGDVDGDGHADLLVGSDLRSSEPLLFLSGSDGRVLGSLPNKGGPFGPAGDVDGDGATDVFVDGMDAHRAHHAGSTTILAADGRILLELAFADWWSEYSATVPLGDVDGDGVPDFLLGEANFNIRGRENHASQDKEVPDLRTMSLAEAVALKTNPRSMSWESGTAWVYSGRTKRVIQGVWGLPGTSDGMGLGGAAIPDLDGDGFAEIVVCDANGAHVFPGPGPDPEARPETK